MPFQYDLQRVLDHRERELEEAEMKFQKANAHLKQLQDSLTANQNQQRKAREDRLSSLGRGSPSLYANHLNRLENEAERLEEDIRRAAEEVAQRRQEMMEAQQAAEVMKKHKQKRLEEHQEAEKKREQDQMNELGLIIKRAQDERESESQ
jgi:flagellar export protein FliJ